VRDKVAVTGIVAVLRGGRRVMKEVASSGPEEENCPRARLVGRFKCWTRFADAKPEVVFGLHVMRALQTGTIGYHIVGIGNRYNTALQSIESRQVDRAVGAQLRTFHRGNRANIIPDRSS
jgi:hypothetical protein